MALLDDVLKDLNKDANADPEKKKNHDPSSSDDEKKQAFTYGSDFQEFAKKKKQ